MAMTTMSATMLDTRRSIFNVKRDNDDLDSFLKYALRMNDVEVSSSDDGDDQERSFPRGKNYPAAIAAAHKKKLPSLRTTAPYPSSTTANTSSSNTTPLPGRVGKRSADIANRIRQDADNLQSTPQEHSIFMKTVLKEEEKRKFARSQHRCNKPAVDSTRIQETQEEMEPNHRHKPSTSNHDFPNSNSSFLQPRPQTSCTSVNLRRKQSLKSPLTYVDLPNIRKDVKKIKQKRKVTKFQEDYGKTSDSLMRLKLHRTEHWSDKKRGKLKKVFRAYLATTPGSSYALDGLF